MNKKANDCALQHIKIFREQSIKKGTADFGEPCEKCPHMGECNYEWLSNLAPLLEHSSIKITLVYPEPNPQLGNAHGVIAMDRGIHYHEGKKNE